MRIVWYSAHSRIITVGGFSSSSNSFVYERRNLPRGGYRISEMGVVGGGGGGPGNC